MKKTNLSLNASVTGDNKQSIPKLAERIAQLCKSLKIRLIIASWLISFMLLFTDSLYQASIALCCFAVSSFFMQKNKIEVNECIEELDKRINQLIIK